MEELPTWAGFGATDTALWDWLTATFLPHVQAMIVGINLLAWFYTWFRREAG